jgi:hypothetical protein
MNVLKTGLEFSDGPKKKPTFIWNSKLIEMYDNEEKYGKKHSMPSPYFMNKFGLKKSDMIFKHTDAEIEEIRKCASDIVYFAEKYCKLQNEYGIIRGVNTNSFIEDIPLDPEVFLQTIDYASKKMVEEIKKEKKIIELNIPTNEVKVGKPEIKVEKPVEVKVEKEEKPVEVKVEEKLEVKKEPVVQPQVTVAKSITEDKMAKLKAQLEALKLAKGK